MRPRYEGVYMIKDYKGGEQRCEVMWDRGWGVYNIRVDGRYPQTRGRHSIGRFLRGQNARKIEEAP